MKKKIIVLVLVLGLASVANAGLFISVGGDLNPGDDIALGVGETVVIDIHGDGQSPRGTNPYLAVVGPGSIGGSTIVYPGTLAEYMELEALLADFGIDKAEMMSYFLPLVAVDCGWAILDDGNIPAAQLTGVLVDNIILSREGQDLGDIELVLYSEDLSEIYDRVTLIPEPITFALLGLGGLFLRRRK